MYRKVLAGGLLLIACLCFMTVQVASQSPITTRPIRGGRSEPVLTSGSFERADNTEVPLPGKDASLHQLLQALEKVKAQEKVLVERITQKIQEQRQELNKAEEQFQRISGSGQMIPSGMPASGVAR